MSDTHKRYTFYNSDLERFVVPLFHKLDGSTVEICIKTGRTHTVETTVGKFFTTKEPDLVYGEVVDRLAELENMMEQKRAETDHGDLQDDLYSRTVRRLDRIGAKDPAAQIIALAEECEEYRAQIKHMREYISHLTTIGRIPVTFPQREAVYREAIAVNGATAQQIVALEELSEAQKEICKLLRSQGSLDHLAEEVADATIVLEQVRLIHGINDLVNKKMDEKVERLRRNLAAVRAKEEG